MTKFYVTNHILKRLTFHKSFNNRIHYMKLLLVNFFISLNSKLRSLKICNFMKGTGHNRYCLSAVILVQKLLNIVVKCLPISHLVKLLSFADSFTFEHLDESRNLYAALHRT